MTRARSSRNGSASRCPSPRAAATPPLEHSNGACRLTQLTAPDAAVARGVADVAVVRGPVQAEGVQSRVLHREERAVVFSRDSALNRVPRVAAGDLAGLHAVMNAQGGTTTAPWLEDMGPGEIRLFTDEGVAVVRPGAARRCRGEGRGLPMMGVLTQPVRKTSTCLTLPSRALT
ncbi:LysR substrate-binding domain-containing protein [Kocuria rhizophila]|uniref:LysR substrate-binding domain-containing protein n=1 Tax=Kocuria rhizophila TaxID=72000 RepID=UPI0037C122E6